MKILINLQKSSSHEPVAGMHLIFSMEYPWGKEIQVYSNKVSGVIIMTMSLKRTNFYKGLFSKKIEKSFFHESLV